MTKTPDEMKSMLSNEVYALSDMYGLHPHDRVTAIASAVARILCQDAPDRQTADGMRKAFNIAIRNVIRDSAENGMASWSHLRMH